MSIPRTLLWAGIVAYATSFLLPAVDGFEAHPGYICAIAAIEVPFAAPGPPIVPKDAFGGRTFVRWAMFVSGLVNVAFPLAMVFRFSGLRRSFRRMRIVLPPMIACSWVVFYFLQFRPLVGHVLWVLGMMLALYSSSAGGRETVDSTLGRAKS